MSRYSDANSFRVSNLLRSFFYLAGLLAILWVFGLWTWHPKKYACFSGWRYYWGKTQVLDVGSLQINILTVRRDCLLGSKDRYDPKQFHSGLIDPNQP